MKCGGSTMDDQVSAYMRYLVRSGGEGRDDDWTDRWTRSLNALVQNQSPQAGVHHGTASAHHFASEPETLAETPQGSTKLPPQIMTDEDMALRIAQDQLRRRRRRQLHGEVELAPETASSPQLRVHRTAWTIPADENSNEKLGPVFPSATRKHPTSLPLMTRPNREGGSRTDKLPPTKLPALKKGAQDFSGAPAHPPSEPRGRVGSKVRSRQKNLQIEFRAADAASRSALADAKMFLKEFGGGGVPATIGASPPKKPLRSKASRVKSSGPLKKFTGVRTISPASSRTAMRQSPPGKRAASVKDQGRVYSTRRPVEARGSPCSQEAWVESGFFVTQTEAEEDGDEGASSSFFVTQG